MIRTWWRLSKRRNLHEFRRGPACQDRRRNEIRALNGRTG